MNFSHLSVVFLSCFIGTGLPAAKGEFAKTLTEENVSAAGLNKLTKAEMTELERLIEAYKSGAGEEMPSPAASAPIQSGIADAVPSRSDKRTPDWVAALITLKRAESNTAKPQVMETQLVGDFSGWTGRTTFRLKNGQVWRQANGDSYPYAPVLKAPKVKIFPGALGSFWMEIEGVGQRCRVRPLQLE